jgi:hypothetical protein
VRIEHQGTIEVQPVYGHVGYTSAAMMNARGTVAAMGIAAVSFVLMGALWVALKWRTRLGRCAALAVLLVGLGAYGAWAASTLQQGRKRQEVADTHMALSYLRGACSAVEKWAETRKRLPTEEEWRSDYRLTPPGKRLYAYRRFDKPGRDGRAYVIVSRPSPRAATPRDEISSAWFGKDHSPRTDDDAPELRALLARYGLAR